MPKPFGVKTAANSAHMSKDEKVITRGRFKGKKVTFASTERIEEFAQLADEFMERIFDLEPGEYLITDESDVRDFTEMGSSDTSEIWKRIDEVYGIVNADVRSGRLVDILTKVVQRRSH
jgi:hypothetical protein